MFALGKPVSSFDIIRFVEDAVQRRDHEKRVTPGADKRSLIGNLIEDAMMEFSSLQNDASQTSSPLASGGAPAGAAPVKLGSFEDVQDWAKDIGVEAEPPSRPGAREYKLGNLAALEDEGVVSGRPALASQAEPVAAPESEPEPEPPTLAQPQHKSASSKAGVAAVVVVALVLAALAALYFSGRLTINL
jgi:hypothetical protein